MRFLSLDEITFRLPVPIGAVLRLSSKVVYTTRPDESPDGEAKVHIMVRAEVEEVDTGVSILRRSHNANGAASKRNQYLLLHHGV